MTTGTPEPPHDLRAWAAEQLGLRADATPAEARAALLELLPEEDFVPPPQLPEAVAVLCERRAAPTSRSPVYQQLLHDQEDHLRAEVEEFAARFFDTPLPQRRSKWQELTNRCQTSLRLRARLRALAPGLAIDPARILDKDPRVQELAEHVCELFLLRPADRAARRLDPIRQIQSEMTTWQNAARRLQKAHPRVAALQSDLVSDLASGEWTQKLLAKRRRRPLRPKQGVPARSTGGAGSRPLNAKPSWHAAAFIIGLVGLIRLMSGLSSHSTYSPAQSLPMRPNLEIWRLEYEKQQDHARQKKEQQDDARQKNLWEQLRKLEELQKRNKIILEKPEEEAHDPLREERQGEGPLPRPPADKDGPAGRPRPAPSRPPAP